MVVDNSTLAAVAACSTRAGLRYVLDMTSVEVNAPMVAGSVAHEVLAEFYKTWNPDMALTKLGTYAAWWESTIKPADDRLASDNVRRVMARWMATHPQQALPFTIDPAFVEVGFAAPLGPGVTYVVRLDGLGIDGAGDYWVVENKTTGRLDERWRRKFRLSSQLSGYVWAARQLVPNRTVVGAYVIGVEFAKLPNDSKRKCKAHGVVYAECGGLHARSDIVLTQRTALQLEEWATTALDLTEKLVGIREAIKTHGDVRALPQEGLFNGSCRECEFADFCAVGRTPEAANAMLKHDPWEPFENAMRLDAARHELKEKKDGL